MKRRIFIGEYSKVCPRYHAEADVGQHRIRIVFLQQELLSFLIDVERVFHVEAGMTAHCDRSHAFVFSRLSVEAGIEQTAERPQEILQLPGNHVKLRIREQRYIRHCAVQNEVD